MCPLNKGTGKEQKIRIESSTGLSDDEIKKMKDEGEKIVKRIKSKRKKSH